MPERVIFQEDGVTVTTARFITPVQTHAMSGITAVRGVKFDPSRRGPALLIALGVLLFFLWGKSIILVALAVFGAGVAWWMSAKPTFAIFLTSSSGEVDALESESEDFIRQVLDALNQAIVERA